MIPLLPSYRSVAGLSMAKEEILWYCRHLYAQPPKSKGKYAEEHFPIG